MFLPHLARPNNYRMAARPPENCGTIRTRIHVDAFCDSSSARYEVPSRKSCPVERRGRPSRLSFRGGVPGLNLGQDTIADPTCTIISTSSIRTSGCWATTSWDKTTQQASNGAIRIVGGVWRSNGYGSFHARMVGFRVQEGFERCGWTESRTLAGWSAYKHAMERFPHGTRFGHKL